MNKNELLSNIPLPVSDAYHEFHKRYFLHNSLTVAAGFAIGMLAVEAVHRFRERAVVQEFNAEFEEFAAHPESYKRAA